MSILISCVGDTDPIRNRHDGPLLHIARNIKPDKIVLIHSERTVEKHDQLVQAIQAIPDYQTEIIIEPTILKNSEIFFFDKMFDTLDRIIQKYAQQEEEILLNLSSATPQVISAMFTINLINDLNVRAFQVTTPVESSNEGVKHDNQIDILERIKTNQDNQREFTSRMIEDRAEKFQKNLLKRTVRDLVERYNYEAALEIITKNKNILRTKDEAGECRRKLEAIVKSVQTQKRLPEVEMTNYYDQEKTILNGYLILELQAKRQLTTEVLIRAKNFAEYIAEMYLEKHHTTVIVRRDDKPYLNPEGNDELIQFLETDSKKSQKTFNIDFYLSLPLYIRIFRFLEPNSQILTLLHKIEGVNYLRNRVAHGFQEVDSKKIRNLNKVCKELLQLTIEADDKWFTFYKDFNEELLCYI